MTGSARYRLGVDVGGTHTDLVLLDAASGEVMVEKVSSTPQNPALGVLNGVARFIARGVAPGEIAFFAHGTTITTNALLEMRGAKVGLLITKGFRAVQEIQSQARDGNLFDYFYARPAPIAPQSLTREIPERIDWSGHPLVPLDRAAVRTAARHLKAAGVESIAVCYLFSFANPAHEQETRKLIAEEFPGVPVSLSSEVLPRLREWPRLSTTLVNAYLEPVLVRYIAHLGNGLDQSGVTTRQRFLMQSNGGVMPFTAAIAGGRTVHTLFSGPAAGGGSIAWVDGSGFLNVGPRSAGAEPGPACYGRGGTAPAVTDADLVCGLLNPDYFLGGTQTLDVAAAHAALEQHAAAPLGLSVIAAATGIRRIVDMRMADEVRVFAAKRGVDLTRFTLLPFGGAGAVHAAAVAEELGMRRILVPPRPGAFSALGLLCTDVVHDHIRSELKPLAEITADHAEAAFATLENRAREELAAEGMAVKDARFIRELDLRYSGQGYELRTPLEGLYGERLDEQSLARVRVRFDERHAQIHGHAAKERPVEVLSYRLRTRVSVPKYQPRQE